MHCYFITIVGIQMIFLCYHLYSLPQHLCNNSHTLLLPLQLQQPPSTAPASLECSYNNHPPWSLHHWPFLSDDAQSWLHPLHPFPTMDEKKPGCCSNQSTLPQQLATLQIELKGWHQVALMYGSPLQLKRHMMKEKAGKLKTQGNNESYPHLTHTWWRWDCKNHSGKLSAVIQQSKTPCTLWHHKSLPHGYTQEEKKVYVQQRCVLEWW